VIGAYLLADKTKKPLRITKVANGIDIALPSKPLDPIATVLVLDTR
jgi:alpha-L-fucosidase